MGIGTVPPVYILAWLSGSAHNLNLDNPARRFANYILLPLCYYTTQCRRCSWTRGSQLTAARRWELLPRKPRPLDTLRTTLELTPRKQGYMSPQFLTILTNTNNSATVNRFPEVWPGYNGLFSAVKIGGAWLNLIVPSRYALSSSFSTGFSFRLSWCPNGASADEATIWHSPRCVAAVLQTKHLLRHQGQLPSCRRRPEETDGDAVLPEGEARHCLCLDIDTL